MARTTRLLPAAALALAGCARGHTAIVLHVRSDLGAALERVEVTVARAGDATPEVDRTYLTGDGGLALPGTIAIVPRDPADTRDVVVHVAATVASAPDVVRDFPTHFVAGTTVDLDVDLAEACVDGAGCDAGVPDAGPGVDCGADAGTPDLRVDFDTSATAPFDRVDPPDAGCFSVVADPARNPPGAARFVLAAGGAAGSRQRCALDWDGSGEHEGSDAYYAWSVYLGAGFDPSAGDVIVAGWTGEVAPVVSLAVAQDGVFEVSLRGGFVDPSTMTVERTGDDPLGVTAVVGVWHDFVVRVVFSQDDATGRVVVWHRIGDLAPFQPVLDEHDMTLQHDSTPTVIPPSFFVGLDRAPAPSAATLVIDRVRRGPSFASVAYDGCGP